MSEDGPRLIEIISENIQAGKNIANKIQQNLVDFKNSKHIPKVFFDTIPDISLLDDIYAYVKDLYDLLEYLEKMIRGF